MKCMFIILNKTEMLDDILTKFTEYGIKGATIFSSTGMAHRLLSDSNSGAEKFICSLRDLLNPEREENKTILCVLKDEQVIDARKAIKEVLGDLDKPDTGIIFTVPVDFIEGASLKL